MYKIIFTNLILIICILVFSCKSAPVLQEEFTAEIIPTEEPLPTGEPVPTPVPEERLIFFDNFDDNTYGWQTGKESFSRFAIKNSFYTFENTHKTDAAFSSIPMEINDTTNFIIETTLVKIGGEGECSYGLVWGCDPETKNACYLIIFEDYALYGKHETGKWETVVNWHRSSFINTETNKNKIAVKKSDDITEIFINERLLFNIPTLPLFGKNIGFILFGNIMIKADFLLITDCMEIDNLNEIDVRIAELCIRPGHEYLFEKPRQELK